MVNGEDTSSGGFSSIETGGGVIRSDSGEAVASADPEAVREENREAETQKAIDEQAAKGQVITSSDGKPVASKDPASEEVGGKTADEIAQEEGLPAPDTPRQRQILLEARRVQEFKEGGFTEAEQEAIRSGQSRIRRAESQTEAEEALETVETNLASAQTELIRSAEEIEAADENTQFLLDGEEVTREEALSSIEEERERLRTEGGGITSDIRNFISERSEDISILGAAQEAGTRADPLSGITTRNIIEDLNPVERTATSAQIALSPAGVEFAAAGILGNREGQREAVEGQVERIRTGELTPGKAATESIFSLPGTAASAGALGAGTIAGTRLAVSRGLVSGATATRALTGVGLATIGAETALIGSEFAAGRTQKGVAETLRFGSGLIGFGLGAQTAGSITGRLTPRETLSDLIPRSNRNIIERDIPTFEQIPGRSTLLEGGRNTRAIRSEGQEFIPELTAPREFGTGLEKPGAPQTRFKPEELEILAGRRGAEFLGRSDQGGAVFSQETGGTRTFREFEEVPLEVSGKSPSIGLRTRKGQAELVPPQTKITQRIENIRQGGTVEPEFNLRLPQFRELSPAAQGGRQSATFTQEPTQSLIPGTLVGTRQRPDQIQQPSSTQIPDTALNLDVPQFEITTPDISQFSRQQGRQRQRQPIRSKQRTRTRQLQRQRTATIPRIAQAQTPAPKLPNFRQARTRTRRNTRTRPAAAAFKLPNFPDVNGRTPRRPKRRTRTPPASNANKLFDIDILSANLAEFETGQATTPTEPGLLQRFRRERTRSGALAELTALEVTSGKAKRQKLFTPSKEDIL